MVEAKFARLKPAGKRRPAAASPAPYAPAMAHIRPQNHPEAPVQRPSAGQPHLYAAGLPALTSELGLRRSHDVLTSLAATDLAAAPAAASCQLPGRSVGGAPLHIPQPTKLPTAPPGRGLTSAAPPATSDSQASLPSTDNARSLLNQMISRMSAVTESQVLDGPGLIPSHAALGRPASAVPPVASPHPGTAPQATSGPIPPPAPEADAACLSESNFMAAAGMWPVGFAGTGTGLPDLGGSSQAASSADVPPPSTSAAATSAASAGSGPAGMAGADLLSCEANAGPPMHPATDGDDVMAKMPQMKPPAAGSMDQLLSILVQASRQGEQGMRDIGAPPGVAVMGGSFTQTTPNAAHAGASGGAAQCMGPPSVHPCSDGSVQPRDDASATGVAAHSASAPESAAPSSGGNAAAEGVSGPACAEANAVYDGPLIFGSPAATAGDLHAESASERCDVPAPGAREGSRPASLHADPSPPTAHREADDPDQQCRVCSPAADGTTTTSAGAGQDVDCAHGPGSMQTQRAAHRTIAVARQQGTERGLQAAAATSEAALDGVQRRGPLDEAGSRAGGERLIFAREEDLLSPHGAGTGLSREMTASQAGAAPGAGAPPIEGWVDGNPARGAAEGRMAEPGGGDAPGSTAQSSLQAFFEAAMREEAQVELAVAAMDRQCGAAPSEECAQRSGSTAADAGVPVGPATAGSSEVRVDQGEQIGGDCEEGEAATTAELCNPEEREGDDLALARPRRRSGAGVAGAVGESAAFVDVGDSLDVFAAPLAVLAARASVKHAGACGGNAADRSTMAACSVSLVQKVPVETSPWKPGQSPVSDAAAPRFFGSPAPVAAARRDPPSPPEDLVLGAGGERCAKGPFGGDTSAGDDRYGLVRDSDSPAELLWGSRDACAGVEAGRPPASLGDVCAEACAPPAASAPPPQGQRCGSPPPCPPCACLPHQGERSGDIDLARDQPKVECAAGSRGVGYRGALSQGPQIDAGTDPCTRAHGRIPLLLPLARAAGGRCRCGGLEVHVEWATGSCSGGGCMAPYSPTTPQCVGAAFDAALLAWDAAATGGAAGAASRRLAEADGTGPHAGGQVEVDSGVEQGQGPAAEWASRPGCVSACAALCVLALCM